ncbi:MAG TPA: DNA methyltransferase [Bryobacteraceae bacterium]|nr:DNA methyltransferase [Bryobacteraceae bacterium]
MAIDRERARQYLKSFDFRHLFLDQLGWDKHAGSLEKVVDGRTFRFQAVSEKRGVVALVSDSIPDYATRAKLDKLIAKDHFEHLIVFVDQAHGRQVWQWVRRESGKPNAIRAYTYSAGQSGELLLQKLEHLVVNLEDEEQTGLADILGRMRAGFDVEKVTKKFYGGFKEEHERFLKFIEGIPDKQRETWYASVMINRLMFLYFIQAKSFLNGDLDYLCNKLKESRDRKKDSYYRDFLCPLFFEGFARKKEERSPAVNKLLGTVPYLNGGLFQQHQIEELHGKKIHVPDSAFTHLFDFFKDYDWHLDDREAREGNEINPDVLGYIFEKYINQKQMGAYYTKEDLTEYISKNTIVPFLLAASRKDCAVAFDKTAGVWRLLRDDPDRYIYSAQRHGAGLKLPPEIAAGLPAVDRRTAWNKTAPSEYALPTELWREVVERRRRYEELQRKLAAGDVTEVNDLVTLNLDIRQFAQDVIQYCEGPELLRALYKAISKVSVLDPTCGSGAFLFAALNILKPMYEACLQRMQMFVDELDAGPAHHPKKFEDFRAILEESRQHPKQDYFILKSIIVNNLYGVDIMEEAVEICKLRLFLKLVAQVDAPDRIEPLPDIDFNIRAGNTLVGYARYEDVEKAVGSKLDFEDAMGRIEDKAKKLDSAVDMFRSQQTRLHGTVTIEDKLALRARFEELEAELNDFLAAEYGTKRSCLKAWTLSHKPFHWFSDFHRILTDGGFDVVVGNPPYVELTKVLAEYRVKGFTTESSGNLYALCLERCMQVMKQGGFLGLVVQQPVTSTGRMKPVRKLLTDNCGCVLSSTYDDRPSKLFDGIHHARIAILTAQKNTSRSSVYVTSYMKWYKEERPFLFARLHFAKDPGIGGRLDVFPKFGSTNEASLAQKVIEHRALLGTLITKTPTDFRLYYKITGVGHWFTITTRPPRFTRKGTASSSSREESISFADARTRDLAFCVMNSSLFYWFYQLRTNCRDFNPSDFRTFPIPTDLASVDFSELGRRLQARLDESSKVTAITYKQTGDVEVETFRPRNAKDIVDEIDRTIAKQYGFSSEEEDFIINYDIKYRLGADVDEE